MQEQKINNNLECVVYYPIPKEFMDIIVLYLSDLPKDNTNKYILNKICEKWNEYALIIGE